MDFSQYKFNPSNVYKIMSNSRAVLSQTGSKELEKIEKKELLGKPLTPKQQESLPRLLLQRKNAAIGKIVLSEGTKNFLRGIYFHERYGSRYKLISTEEKTGVASMVRGIKTEDQGVMLVSEIDNKRYFAYKKIVSNDFLSGRLDIIDSYSLESATKILDIKSSGDIDSFFNKIECHFTDANMYQMQSYFSITGLSNGEIVHCLVGEPEYTIQQQKKLLFEKYCPDGIENDKFATVWAKAESSMRFLDIPKKSRLISKIIERDDSIIDLIHDTIVECRNWLNEYHIVHEEFSSKRYI